MKLIQLLLEYNREKTLSSWAQKIDLASKQDQNKSAEEILSHIEDIDPSINKQFVQWIVKQYVDKNLQFDDLSVVKFPLTTFQRYKNRLPHDQRDINKLTVSDLFAIHDKIINPTLNDDKDGVLDKISEEQFGPDVKVWYNGPLGSLTSPLTMEASCRLGKGTKWCTSSTIADNMFDSYNKLGNLYIWRDKNGDKYQIFLIDDDIHDDKNEPVSDETRLKLMSNPILKQLLSKDGKIYKTEIKQFVKKIVDNQDAINDIFKQAERKIDSDDLFVYSRYCGILKSVGRVDGPDDIKILSSYVTFSSFSDELPFTIFNKSNDKLIWMIKVFNLGYKVLKNCKTGLRRHITLHAKEMDEYIKQQMINHNMVAYITSQNSIPFFEFEQNLGKSNQNINLLRNNSVALFTHDFKNMVLNMPLLAKYPFLHKYIVSIANH